MNHFRRAIVTDDVCVFAEGARHLARQVRRGCSQIA